MILAQTFTATTQAAAGFSFADLSSLVAILSLVAAGWQRVKASNYRAMLHAAAVGLQAAMDALPKTEAEQIKAGIKEAVGDLNEPMKAEVRKATQPNLPVYREDGLPKLGALLLLGLFLSSGCVSAAIHDSAVEAQRSAALLHKASVPAPAYNEAERAAWERLWVSHEAALKAIEEAAR